MLILKNTETNKGFLEEDLEAVRIRINGIINSVIWTKNRKENNNKVEVIVLTGLADFAIANKILSELSIIDISSFKDNKPSIVEKSALDYFELDKLSVGEKIKVLSKS